MRNIASNGRFGGLRGLLVIGAVAAIPLTVSSASAESKSWGPGANDAAFAAMLKSSFKTNGIATVERLNQDETQAFCSDPKFANSPEAAKMREKIEAANMATVKWPSDGVFLGDWKKGEKTAQSGKGLTWTDKAEDVNGGNCYNCHQITPEEISHGTIGPSLLHYGKNMGYDKDVIKATWARVYNSKSVNACSNMPRAGHAGIINEGQIKDIMALLFDPESPTNR